MMSDSEDTAVIEETKSKFRTMTSFANWSQIKAKLNHMAQSMYDTAALVKVLRQFKFFSAQDRSQSKHLSKNLQFEILVQLYDDQLPEIYQKIAAFVLQKNNYQYPLFQRQKVLEHTFSKDSILFLVCSMALCLIPKQFYHEKEHAREKYCYEYDFSYIFDKNKFKTKCIMEYLRKEMDRDKRNEQLTIKREVVVENVDVLIKEHKDQRLCKFTMTGDNESIQDFYGEVKVDFANSFIGGGALSSGCVQEEIMFATHPELYATQLLCESMEPNEAIHLIGFRRYARNKGYSYKTSYLGPELHQYVYDEHKRAKEYITAIDALALPKKDSIEQFRWNKIKREILKAYVGFKFEENHRIVTGNWGCGAFGGDIRIKLIIQWIACSMAKKVMIYCPFGQRKQAFNKVLFDKLSIMPLGEVYSLLMKASSLCIKATEKQNIAEISVYQKILWLLDPTEEKSGRMESIRTYKKS